MYTHEQSQNNQTKIKYNRLPSLQMKPKIIPVRTKLTRAQTGKQN